MAKTIHLTKAEFLQKVANTRPIPTNGFIWETNPVSSIFMPTGAVHAKW
jgi:hypothetical protein